MQSVAVRLIVEREREIRAFIPEEFWQVHADLKTADDVEVRFEVVRFEGAPFKPKNEAEATAATSVLATSTSRSVILNLERQPQRRLHRLLPRLCSKQQSTRLGFSVKKTMTLAQRLTRRATLLHADRFHESE